MNNIVVDLDTQLFAEAGQLSLDEVLTQINEWPADATCATQDSDGGVLYWNAPVAEVIAGRERAGTGDIMPEIGLGAQIHCAYLNLDNPVLAKNWSSAVSINPIHKRP